MDVYEFVWIQHTNMNSNLKRKMHKRIKQTHNKIGLKSNQEIKIIKNNTTWN